jgi:hypothetical protein
VAAAQWDAKASCGHQQQPIICLFDSPETSGLSQKGDLGLGLGLTRDEKHINFKPMSEGDI